MSVLRALALPGSNPLTNRVTVSADNIGDLSVLLALLMKANGLHTPFLEDLRADGTCVFDVHETHYHR